MRGPGDAIGKRDRDGRRSVGVARGDGPGPLYKIRMGDGTQHDHDCGGNDKCAQPA